MTERCGAYHHRGTVRCEREATRRVVDTRDESEVGLRCEPDTRKYVRLAPRFRVERLEVSR